MSLFRNRARNECSTIVGSMCSMGIARGVHESAALLRSDDIRTSKENKKQEKVPEAKEDLLEAYVAQSNMNTSQQLRKELMRVKEEFKLHSTDSGSSPVQIARLTKRIAHLNRHMQQHPKDKHTKHGLIQLVDQRRKLLKYMKRKDVYGYANLIASLGIKDRSITSSASARPSRRLNESPN